MISKAPKVVLIGGGTGSFTILGELKKVTPNIVAIVNMSDDGGSTGTLRDELGVLPPGDVRQCLVALSNISEVRELFDYRFPAGKFENQSLGNIIISGLELRYDDFAKAVRIASQLLNITGKVVPVTLEKHQLVMHDGKEEIVGEYIIGHRPIINPDAKISLRPNSDINPDAKQAIIDADLVVIAPGNLYGSLLPALAVQGMTEAFEESNAQKIVISNLVTKPGQTDGWHVVDYVKKVEEYTGKDTVDLVIYNNRPPQESLLKTYAQDKEYPVRFDQARFSEINAQPIGLSLVADKIATQDPNDTVLSRTLIRHDAASVCRQLIELAQTRIN